MKTISALTNICDPASNTMKKEKICMGSRKTTFRYILRQMIDPSFDSQARIEELVTFCRENSIEDVMLFMDAEELNTGHPLKTELEPYIGMAKILKNKLCQAGIELSLNPWVTLHHDARGRKLKPFQNFAMMVGENGETSPLSTCPLCPNWQSYICDIFSYLAKELTPSAIWIEDDWRLHNHGSHLGWGGCFCPAHLDRFTQISGIPVSRTQLLENILAPGIQHPWRKLWLQISRDSLLEPARKLKDSICTASPSTEIGLMSSRPDVHSTEGRNWRMLGNAFTNTIFLSRPHIEPYTETNALQTPPSVTRHTIANLKRPVKIYPELENSPRCGQYSKSAAFSIWQMFNAAVYGSHGITINHFDMMGNGITLDADFGPKISRAKKQLNALTELEIDDGYSQGVNVLFSPEISSCFQTAPNCTSMKGLTQDSTVWSKTFFILGIAHQFTKDITASSQPYAVSGQTLRCFDDDAIIRLLSGKCLLDGYSVDVLLQRGFGKHIGVNSAAWQKQAETGFSYESINENNATIYGISNPRMTAQRCADQMLEMQLLPHAETLSVICRYDHQPLFPAAAIFRNELGGKIVTFAYPLDGAAQYYMGFFNAFRRQFIQHLLFEITPDAHLAVAEKTPLHLYRVKTHKGILFAAFNVLLDEIDEVVIRLPKNQIQAETALMLDKQGHWQKQRLSITQNHTCAKIHSADRVGPLAGVFILANQLESD